MGDGEGELHLISAFSSDRRLVAEHCAGRIRSVNFLKKVLPDMNDRFKRGRRWLASLRRGRLRLGLLSVLAAPLPSLAQGTPDERRACTPDVFRLCSAFIPNAEDIAVCLRQRQRELSDACRQVIRAGMSSSDDGAVEGRRRGPR